MIPRVHNNFDKDQIYWSKPPAGCVKINFDGSKLDNNKAAASFRIKDHNDKVLLLRARPCGQTSVLMAEVLALRKGIMTAKHLGITNLAIEGDNICVINSLREI